MSAAPHDVNEPTPPRRARLLRRLSFALLAVLVVLACAPLWVDPLLRRSVVNALEDELDARARVQSVSFAWPARLALRGVELTAPDGAPLAVLDELRAEVALGKLLTGKLDVEVEVQYPELHVSRAADGRWNWERALAEAPAREHDGADDEQDRDAGSDEAPDVRARLRLSDGHVVVHGPEGETTLDDIAFSLDVEGLDRPAPFRLSLAVRGPQGPAGGLALEGSFTAASAGRIDAYGMEGSGKLELQELALAAFAPALALVAPVDELGGTLDGKGEFVLGAGLALAGQADFEVRTLALRGPRSAAPAEIARIAFRGRATQHGGGAGEQDFRLTADSFLDLSYAGRSNAPASGAGELAGKLTLAADLARASEIARGWVPLQEGVALAGRVEGGVELGAVLADRSPTSARVQARAGLEKLSARDSAGHALDLSELAGLAFELDGTADLARGTLSVTGFALRAGAFTCEGALEAAGPAAGQPEGDLELRTGSLRLAADLEKLRGTLAQVVDLGTLTFGGRMSADATLKGTGSGIDLAARFDGEGLAFGPAQLAELHGQLGARRAEDGVLSGSGELRLGRLVLRLDGREPLVVTGASAELGLREDAAGKGEHELTLATSDGALAFGLRARSERTEEETDLRADWTLAGRVAELARLSAPFTPLQPGLAGELSAKGELAASVSHGELARAGGKLELALTDLGAEDARGAPLALASLARTTVALEGSFDARAKRAEIPVFTLTAGGLELSGSARVLDPAGAPALERGELALQADLERLGPDLGRILDLAGWSVAGSPLTAALQLSTQEQRIEADGRLDVATLRLAHPERAPLVLADVGIEFDLGYDAGLGSLHVRSAAARSSTGELELAGTLNELSAPERTRGAMQCTLRSELARLLGDLGLETPESGRKTSGALSAELALEGDGGAFHVTGRTTVQDFRLELAPETAGAAPLVIEEPRVALDADARVTLAQLDVELTKLALESGHARGGAEGRIENLRALAAGSADAGEVRFVGLKGQLAYVPDRLGALLGPLLPGKLSGAEEERVSFTLDGRARDLDLATLLSGSQARVDLGLGRFELPEATLDGALVLETKDEKLLVRGDLGANGGTMQLDGELELAPDAERPRSRLAVTAKAVRANARLAPLLGKVHPAFGAARLARGSLDGLVGLALDLSYDAPLPLDVLGAGWEALPKQPIHGTGRFEISSAALRDSPFLELLAGFGFDVQKAVDLRPIEFTIEKGRLTYARPWTWTFDGTETTFTGSIGLDESLDLAWNVPITPALVKRWDFLAFLEGELLSIPLRGSVKAPRLEMEGLLKDLAARAAKSELESRLGLGGNGGDDDPAAVLERADTLWKEGKKSEAAALYIRLRENFKLTLTYALNKDRIRERSKYVAPK